MLCIEGYRSWCTLLRYDLTVSSYTHLFPVLMKQLLYYVEKVDLCIGTSDQFTYDVGSWLLTVFTTILGSSLSWSQVVDLRLPIETCCRKWLVQLSRLGEPVSTSANNLVAASLNFLAVFFVKLKGRDGYNKDQFKATIDERFGRIFNELLSSDYFTKLCKLLPSFSGYLSPVEESKRSLSSLPVAGAVLHKGHVHPFLRPTSPLFFVSSLCRLVSVCGSGGQSNSILSKLSAYTSSLLTCRSLSVTSNWFSRFESRLLFWLLSTEFECGGNISSIHRLSIRVCGLIQRPDEVFLHELLDKVVFSHSVLQSEYLVNKCMESLSVDSTLPLSSPSNLPGQTLGDVLKTCLEEQDGIKSTYYTKLVNQTRVRRSIALHSHQQGVQRLVVEMETILTQDWEYYPLLQIYNWEQSGKKIGLVRVEDMRNCLAWLLLTDSCTSNTASQTVAKFYRLATVFLAGSDLFLDPGVHSLLAALLSNLLAGSGLPDLSLPVPGLTSPHEFYLQLLDQFQAVSYGDQLFSLFIVIPLGLNQPPAFRRSFWTERPDIARSISLKRDHLRSDIWIALSAGTESNSDILVSYFNSLRDKRILSQRNSLLYDFACSQVGKLLKPQVFDNDAQKQKLRQYITTAAVGDAKLRCDLNLDAVKL